MVRRAPLRADALPFHVENHSQPPGGAGTLEGPKAKPDSAAPSRNEAVWPLGVKTPPLIDRSGSLAPEWVAARDAPLLVALCDR
jgi:hypothetical protein